MIAAVAGACVRLRALGRSASLLSLAQGSCRAIHDAVNPTGPPAFVFDIDGVLVRGRQVLHPALEALRELCSAGAWRFPVCFLTNGGGVSESHKAQQLARWLGVPVHEQQVILSHTPMRSLARHLGQQPVLVVGRGDVLSVAAGYGMGKVLSTTQLAAALPGALPFADTQQPATDEPCPVRDLGWGSEQQRIAAALVMADPAGAHWYQDLQLLMDVITSHGVPQRQQPLPGSQPIEVYFSNPDLLWAAEYSRPRFGQGAFATALDALHRQLTGTPLPNARWFGKPNPEPYRLAEQQLAQQALQLGLVSAQPFAAEAVAAPGARGLFSAIYAVGDNPAADVRGANLAGPPWVSVLVRTGVFRGSANSEADPAHIVVDDVLAAVRAGMHRSRSSKWHSMR